MKAELTLGGGEPSSDDDSSKATLLTKALEGLGLLGCEGPAVDESGT